MIAQSHQSVLDALQSVDGRWVHPAWIGLVCGRPISEAAVWATGVLRDLEELGLAETQKKVNPGTLWRVTEYGRTGKRAGSKRP